MPIRRGSKMVSATVSNLKVAILGFGTVGSSVARILCDLKPQGIELTHIYNRNVARKSADWVQSTSPGLKTSRRFSSPTPTLCSSWLAVSIRQESGYAALSKRANQS